MVSVLVRTTAAPGTTPPVESVTVPVSAPVPADWANSEGASTINPAIDSRFAVREPDGFIDVIRFISLRERKTRRRLIDPSRLRIDITVECQGQGSGDFSISCQSSAHNAAFGDGKNGHLNTVFELSPACGSAALSVDARGKRRRRYERSTFILVSVSGGHASSARVVVSFLPAVNLPLEIESGCAPPRLDRGGQQKFSAVGLLPGQIRPSGKGTSSRYFRRRLSCRAVTMRQCRLPPFRGS